MKRILKMLLTLTTTTTIPLTVVACGQQDLDDSLNAVYKGETSYNVNDVIKGKSVNPNAVTAPINLTNDESTELAKAIVQLDLTKAKLPEVTWYQKDLDVNQKCYNFNITNGKDEDQGKTWDVNDTTQRFNITISYEVGSVSADKSFKANQKIDLSFNIKVGTSASDGIIDKWVKNFNDKDWNINNPIVIDLTNHDPKIPLPSDVSWNDLDKKVVAVVYEAISDHITWDNSTSLAYVIKGQAPISEHKLQLTLDVNLNDAKASTQPFYIIFQ